MQQEDAPPLRHAWLRGFLGAVVGLCALTLVLETWSLLGATDGGDARLRRAVTANHAWTVAEVYADADADAEVPAADRLHLSLLHEACVTSKDAVVPWQLGSPRGRHQRQDATANNGDALVHRNDTDALEKLRRCPDVDVFLPSGLRGNGYCEDAVAYAKYLDSRLLPRWVLETKLFDPALGRHVDYYDLCPKTPVIFFNHYWDGVPDSPRWPKDKPLYLMPNIEMIELTPAHYWGVDAVLCKTQVCHDRVTRWYAENGNPRNAQVFYTKHTSSDQAEFARHRLGNESVAPKDFATVKFVHTAGTSVWKGTRELVDCWVMASGLPQLDVYIDDSAYNFLFRQTYQRRLDRARSPVHIEHGMLEPQDFSKLTAESAFFMCPSRSEGYGHYINQARASGGVVITTDAHPMNELIVGSDMGVLIPTRSQHDPKMLLGGKFKGEHGLKDPDGLLVRYNSRGLCTAVREFVASTTSEQRAAMGERARQQYHEDTKFFARAMRELREFARNQ
ncbi:hypothetical protein PHYPSEUDO_012078 [Phytophthora pseudosyringae]|uniref:Glycosyl transferase family 1 domain-containing protein n=1 Tax=Phytophthora pseudosyringae TaxID=221518 RepID=A0A8T1VA30_9STRA|nr:hypothetical protein PHYPSEUDO_012078 [Phytophthora pseudosyringae]